MSDEEMDRRVREIAILAKKQREGAYGPQSNAMQALHLIETLALLLLERMDDDNRAVDAGEGKRGA